MLSSLRLKLEGEAEKFRGDFFGPLLQGYIMENIDSTYAAKLHESMLHPYSQYIRDEQGQTVWTLNTLNSEAKENIIDIVGQKNNIYLKHKEKELKIKGVEENNITYTDLVKKYYLPDGKRRIDINFLTPTSFKRDGKYCIFPDVRLIFQSLMLKFDNASADMEVFGKDVLKDFEDNIEISKYRLRSTVFHLEGVKIPSFIGEVTLNMRGPTQLVNLANMLIAFGTYSGVGIKTGIGMGGISFD